MMILVKYLNKFNIWFVLDVTCGILRNIIFDRWVLDSVKLLFSDTKKGIE